MRIKASGIHRANIGQVITIDQIDDEAGSESVITGTLQAFERTADKIVLTVGINEYELEMDDTVDIMRSTVLAELSKVRAQAQEEGDSGATRVEMAAMVMLEDAVGPNGKLRRAMEDAMHVVLPEVVRHEFALQLNP